MTNIKFLSEQRLTILGPDPEDIFMETFYKDEIIEASMIGQDDNFANYEYDSESIILRVPLSEIEILDA